MKFANKGQDLAKTSSQEIVDSESLQVKLQSRVKDRSRGTGFGSGAARCGLLRG